MVHTDTTTFSSDRYILSKCLVFQAGIKENRYTYTAREWDSESANYYYRARYNNPSIGRFLSADPIGYVAGINLYSYVWNNPIRYVDATGQILKPNAADTTAILNLLNGADGKNGLCPDGGFTTDANGNISAKEDFCKGRYETIWETRCSEYIGYYWIAKLVWIPPGSETSSTPTSCKCICDIINDKKHTTTIKIDTTKKTETRFDQSGVFNPIGLQRQTGSNCNVSINPKEKHQFEGETAEVPLYISLGHELCGHALPAMKGEHTAVLPLPSDPHVLPLQEIYSYSVERLIEAEHGLPLRPYDPTKTETTFIK